MEARADHELMARVARGDQTAFRLLSQRHAAAALGLAKTIVGNEAVAEELVQEAFLRVWVNAPRWRPQAKKQLALPAVAWGVARSAEAGIRSAKAGI